MIARPEIVEVGVRKGCPFASGTYLPHADHLVWLEVRQWLKQHAIDNAENCRAGADAQRQCEYAHNSEYWILAKYADAVTRVLKRALQIRPAPHLSCGLLDNAEVSKFAAGRVMGLFGRLALLNPVLHSHLQMAL